MTLPRRIHESLRGAIFAAAVLLAAAPALAARTVMVFGDSLSAAYNLSPEQGWVHLIGERITRAGLPWRMVNASISGETTAGGLRRLAEDLRRHKPSVVVIALGANDALRGLPVAGMRSNLEKMIGLVRQAHMYAELAARDAIALVPFLLEGIADKPELFQRDQLHPTAEAQPRIADNVWPALAPVLKKAP